MKNPKQPHKKQQTTKIEKNVKSSQVTVSVPTSGINWKTFSIKLCLLFVIILAVIVFTDIKGYFTADQTDNHVNSKWKSFYKFTKTKNVDIIFIGNSHVITGVEPYIMSVATGCNCFILGNAGTDIADAWFHLGEALKLTKPKLIILETYCIGNSQKVTNNDIAQIKSFEAHNDVIYKLQTMPELFYSDSWVKAWSPSIRNHTFLLTDMNRIKYNIKNPNPPQSDKLDLGRFSRFTSGLEDSIIAKYDSLGAPVKGSEYKISDHSRKYLKKIMNLCEKNNVRVLFLTIPMYYRHIDNYSEWKETLGEELQKYSYTQWLDLQQPYDSLSYTKDAFENTYTANQHLTFFGMSVTSYKIAKFLFENNYTLPDRTKEASWITDFNNQDHFVFNQQSIPETGYKTIAKDQTIEGLHIKELLVKELSNSNRVVLKVDNNENLKSTITVQFLIEYHNTIHSIPIQMHTFVEINPPQHKVYFAELKKDVRLIGFNQ
jgi:hypothetical protein